ncbi:hypothetical protein C8R44DRAFT_729381 [Mycena epipterygia]|nr:hypothetical protein C8R44DRAFT_729381 [Mycena epipterygia]
MMWPCDICKGVGWDSTLEPKITIFFGDQRRWRRRERNSKFLQAVYSENSQDLVPHYYAFALNSFQVLLYIGGNQEIMRYLALPALEDLYFGNLLELEDDIFLPFLTRSRGSLRNFTFSCWSPGLVLPMQWFRHMAHLTSLTLPHLQPQSKVNFVRAWNREHEREFLPTLKDLTLTDWNPDDVDMQLLDALETRCTRTETEDGQARMQLKSFRLIWTAELPGTSIPSLGIASLVHRHGVALRDLQGSGMRIHIGTENKDFFGCSTAVVAGVNVATGHLSY